MTFEKAQEISNYINIINRFKVLCSPPSTAQLPDYYIKNLLDLCQSHEGFRHDFYKIMEKLGDKYYKQFQEILNKI